MSHLVEAVAFAVKALRLPEPTREYQFAPPRRWRFDLAWPDRRLAVEIEGGTWIRGRHSRGAGMSRDAEKYNEATLSGWRVLRLTSDMVTKGAAVALLERALR